MKVTLLSPVLELSAAERTVRWIDKLTGTEKERFTE